MNNFIRLNRNFYNHWQKAKVFSNFLWQVLLSPWCLFCSAALSFIALGIAIGNEYTTYSLQRMQDLKQNSVYVDSLYNNEKLEELCPSVFKSTVQTLPIRQQDRLNSYCNHYRHAVDEALFNASYLFGFYDKRQHILQMLSTRDDFKPQETAHQATILALQPMLDRYVIQQQKHWTYQARLERANEQYRAIHDLEEDISTLQVFSPQTYEAMHAARSLELHLDRLLMFFRWNDPTLYMTIIQVEQRPDPDVVTTQQLQALQPVVDQSKQLMEPTVKALGFLNLKHFVHY